MKKLNQPTTVRMTTTLSRAELSAVEGGMIYLPLIAVPIWESVNNGGPADSCRENIRDGKITFC